MPASPLGACGTFLSATSGTISTTRPASSAYRSAPKLKSKSSISSPCSSKAHHIPRKAEKTRRKGFSFHGGRILGLPDCVGYCCAWFPLTSALSPRAYHYPQLRNVLEGNPEGIVPSSPGLRACELPWEIVQTWFQPQRGCGHARPSRTQ